jgi:nitrile hydratase subunit beta
MDGEHDLGGALGQGPVLVEPNEPVFHHAWEGLAFALNMVSIGKLRAYNADAYRHSVERVPGYLGRSYYERLLTGVTTLLVESGVVEASQIERLAGGSVVISAPVASSIQLGSEGFSDSELSSARFAIGDQVVVAAMPTEGHTRCPAYLRGAVGVIEQVYTLAHVPEVRAHSSARCREHTYAVTFEARRLWPQDFPDDSPVTNSPVTTSHTVIVEVFESYLEPFVEGVLGADLKLSDGVPNPVGRLESNPAVGFEVKRRSGPAAQVGVPS